MVRKITSCPASRRRTPSWWTPQAPMPGPAMRSTNGEKRMRPLSPSISDGGARRAAAVAGAVEPAIGDLDQLGRTPGPPLDEPVAHAAQQRHRVGRQAEGLVGHLVGLSLEVQPRRI